MKIQHGRTLPAHDRRRGIAAVEAVLVMPLLLLVTFATIEYGWMFMKAQQITDATRNGARMGINPDATASGVINLVNAQLSAAGLTGGNYVQVTPTNLGGLLPGEMLTVKTTVPYSDVDLLKIAFIPTPSQLRAEVTMAREGP